MRRLLELVQSETGMKKKEVAEWLGVTPNHYSRLVSGKHYSKDFQRLVDMIDRFDLKPLEVIEALKKDYSSKK